MEIKNIIQYRSFYKTTRPVSPLLQEDFIGNYYIEEATGEKQFGWFTMYHGDRDGFSTPEAGIENFLQSFLDMAKDGQAVYEFLQNAVDAGSTHYTMVWGQDEVDGNYYLLVANNGEMFTPNSIRSILNVGSSTKNADSRTIGKFGIGFKLAHRLVGKDNGLQELINESSGPLLFSWKNDELARLAKGSDPMPMDIQVTKNEKGEIVIKDEYPWLFKILITCFPCLPENSKVVDLPKMVTGKKAELSPFSRAEYEVLSRWVRKSRHILSKETYNEGALFFIKLGSGKETELAEKNLKGGVRFALAILRETADVGTRKDKILQTVQLNDDEPITYPDLSFIKLTVDKETDRDTYAYVRFGVHDYEDLTLEQKKKISQESNIEALFGFRRHFQISDYFLGAPNLYLYFPLSEEVHNFNYILHSNAFYKGSSRTFLHKGSSKEDGINERLFKTIVDKVDRELARLSSSTNEEERELFLDFYAALLTSERSLNQDRKWIEEPYIDQIDNLLTKYIPVKSSYNSTGFEVSDDVENVFFKKTQVDVDLDSWDLANLRWFYWGEEADVRTRLNAFSKMGVEEFGIYDLLTAHDSISDHLNEWIKDDPAKAKVILQEIANLDGELVKDPVFKKNLFNTKLLKFTNGEFISISEFQEKERDGYFIIFNKLNEIRDLLSKLGLLYTNENFDDYNFNPKYFSFFTGDSQVKSYTTLTRLFSKVVADEKLGKLTVNEKHRIFEAFRTFNESPGERMGELKLARNNNHVHACFKNLYAKSTIPWLHKFCISSVENHASYKNYLLDKLEGLYQGIIYPYWSEVASYVANNPGRAKETLDSIVDAYEKSDWPEKYNFLLNTPTLVIFNSSVVESENVYYNSDLLALPDERFENIQSTVLRYFQVHIPDKCLLPYLDKQPFSSACCNLQLDLEEAESSFEDVDNLLLFSKTCDLGFFDSNYVQFQNGKYWIGSTVKKQISTTKTAVVNYVEKYHSGEFVLIPENFAGYKGDIELTGSKLIEHLIGLFKECENLELELDLVEIILQERFEDKKSLLKKLTYTNLDAGWIEERQNELYIKLLKAVIEGEITPTELQEIHNKISIFMGEQQIIIGEIDSAHDSIEVTRVDKMITLSQSQVLNLESADNIKLIQSFHDEAKKRDLVNQTTADKLFKLSSTGITEELVERFKDRLEENKLENSHQLLFVLLSGYFKKEDLKDYSLKSFTNTWYTLEDQVFFPTEENREFVDHVHVLSDDYSDLQSLLQLNDFEAFNYGENEDDLMAPRFLFVGGCNPEVLESDANIHDKLTYLYKGWANTLPQNRHYKRGQDWEEYLGIRPQEYLLNGICIAGEQLPEEFLAWHNNEKKKDDFFIAIGIHVNESPLQKLRRYLIGELKQLPKEIEVGKFSDQLLLNTLNGVAGSFLHLKAVPLIFQEHDKERLALLEQIVNSLVDSEVGQYPVVIHKTDNSFRILDSHENSVYYIKEDLYNKLKLFERNNLEQVYAAYPLLRLTPSLNEKIVENSIELEFEMRFVLQEDRVEHDEPFYRQWKEEHEIELYKEKEILYDVYIETEDKDVKVARIADGSFYVDERDDISKIHYLQNSTLENLREDLGDDYEELSESIDDLIHRRNVMLASIYNTLNAAGKGEVNNAHLEALQAAFKEENLKQERNELIEEIKSNNDYSYEWFDSYLKFLLTFESKQDTTKQKSISFQAIKQYLINDEISNRYFLLCGASSMIPLNIEDFEDFKITLVIKNKQNETIIVEGVSKKGQDLLIYCREPITQATIRLFKDVIQVKISFSPVIDLLQRLYNAFTNRHYLETWEEIKDVLPSLHFIYGPPGTGKTTTLCCSIINGIKEKYNARYLILTPTNKAADVLCKKLLIPAANPNDKVGIKLKELAKASKHVSITRVGKPTDPELEALQESVYSDSVDMKLLDCTNVIASTIHRVPYFEVFDEDNDESLRLFELPNHWDYVIFDESSMINLPYLVFAILSIYKFNPNAKFIVAGDPKQIPPVVDVNDKDLEELDIQDENVYTMMSVNSFKRSEQVLRGIDKITNLETQYRSVKHIGQLFSSLSYSGLLKHDREQQNDKAKILPASFAKLLNKNVTFIDIPLNVDNSIFKISKLLYSSYHIYSAIFVAELLKYLDSLLDAKESWTVGLIAPYKAQAILLNKLVTSYGLSEKLKVYSDTVHGFQGDECDIVFFISNPNNYYYTGHPRCLLSKEYIYNVAISRARDYLVILHPFESIKANTFINSVCSSYDKYFEHPVIRKSSDFEKHIFGQKDFIEKNSYITGHDNVNVFGQIEMKYFIKANEGAIDIQLRKFES
ncbi:AAA domain-containing protein [Flavisolibacter ginsenosidimutans]|uniref:AAA family ATPase n=1 Tax=Flavisolibacter ginsenosidimutans TaxID=661481 RepID=A0A5B8UFL7_9BACT|nr:AAA domain-containing protein [Flavisolibacter ginsenosidimutans]QEC55273.1 AAA family ATPase [Flavisolibacter ginsenosidimutans]